MKPLTIVIAEDSVVIKDLLKRMLSEIDGFHIVGAAANGIEAVWLVNELKPRVLILDVTMPLMDGLEVLEEIRKGDPSTLIIMFTADPNPLIRRDCFEAGADHFLDKSQIAELIEICKKELLAG